MPTHVQQNEREITIDYSDRGLGIQKIKGIVQLHLHELDGSETIVIRTEPRESVKLFLREEIAKWTT